MSVGQDLLNVPFPDMVRSLAMAIADGQRSLDKTSVDTARLLAEEKVSLIEEIWEVITRGLSRAGGGTGFSVVRSRLDPSAEYE